MEQRPWWAWWCAAAAVIAGGLGWFVPGPSFDPLEGAVVTGAILVVAAAGLVALGQPGQRSNGQLMLWIALAMSSDSFARGMTGPWHFLGFVLDPFDGLLLLLLLLRWPGERLQTRAQARLFWVGWLVIPPLWLADGLTWHPGWEQPVDPGWWPALLNLRTLNTGIYLARLVVVLVLLATYVGLVAARVRSASRPERRELVPVVVATVTLVTLYVARFVIELGGGPFPLDLFTLLFNIAYLAVPVAFLAALAVRRVQRALAVESLMRPERLPTPAAVRQALARAMGDDGLGLALYSPGLGGYVDVDGAPAAAVPAGRPPIEVPAADGTPNARVDVDARLARRPELTDSVARAAVVALDNARLQADLRAQLRQTEASRQQLEEVTKEGERLSRLLPSGLAAKLRADPSAVDRTEHLTVTVLMSDVRGYSGIAERTEPAVLARQLNEHRRAMNGAILAEGGTVMQYVGDAVMAVFGAPFPQPDHAAKALGAATQMHHRQAEVNAGWVEAGLAPFGLGIGLSTGPVAAALLGSDERVEYTLVGDTVNLAQRLQDAARPAGSTVASAATVKACGETAAALGLTELAPLQVKGRSARVAAYRSGPSPVDVSNQVGSSTSPPT
jgi:class 3 adenylate cyclase